MGKLFTVAVPNIDIKLLKQQRRKLFSLSSEAKNTTVKEAIEGLISLCDYIVDLFLNGDYVTRTVNPRIHIDVVISDLDIDLLQYQRDTLSTLDSKSSNVTGIIAFCNCILTEYRIKQWVLK